MAVPRTVAANWGNALPQDGGKRKVGMRFQGTLTMRRKQLRTIKSVQLRKSLEQKILEVREKNLGVVSHVHTPLRLPEAMRTDFI